MTSSSESAILLDTHIWIWLINGDAKFKSTRVLQALETKDRIYVSMISCWEVGMLHAKGRIQLPGNPLDWVRHALRAPGINLATITTEIVVDSCFLSEVSLSDPVDRIILTTAQSHDATLITQDAYMLKYCRRHHIKAMDTIT